jgi:hypothetical protein
MSPPQAEPKFQCAIESSNHLDFLAGTFFLRGAFLTAALGFLVAAFFRAGLTITGGVVTPAFFASWPNVEPIAWAAVVRKPSSAGFAGAFLFAIV